MITDLSKEFKSLHQSAYAVMSCLLIGAIIHVALSRLHVETFQGKERELQLKVIFWEKILFLSMLYYVNLLNVNQRGRDKILTLLYD